MAFLFDNVVTMLMISYELSVCTLFVPIIAALLSNQPSRSGSYLSMGLGALGFILFRQFDLLIPKEVMAVSLSTLGYIIGNMFLASDEITKSTKELRMN